MLPFCDKASSDFMKTIENERGAEWDLSNGEK
jgi:hypothetical protein